MAAKTGGTANCHAELPLTSTGFWLKSSSLKAQLPLLMIQITLIVSVSRFLHHFLRHLGQPIIVSQILTGIILGPSLLGKLVGDTIFPLSTYTNLSTLSMVGFSLFLFTVGVKMDLSMIRKSGRKALLIGLSGHVAPIAFVYLGALALSPLPATITRQEGALNLIAILWCKSPFVVVSSLLGELRLLNSKVGRLAISASLILDFAETVLLSVIVSWEIAAKTGNRVLGWGSFVSFIGLLSFIVLVARPAIVSIIRRTPHGELMDDAYFVAVLMLSLSCGLVSEVIGHRFEVGMFVLGLALPGGPPLGSTLSQKLDAVVMNLAIPMFVAGPGLTSDITSLPMVAGKRTWVYLPVFLLFSFVGKVVGVMLPAAYCKVKVVDALPLALIMASKGITELRLAEVAKVHDAIDADMHTVLTVYVGFLAAVLTPAIRALYHPSQTYNTNKRRSIQHTRDNVELRVLACVHHHDNVSPFVDLLDAMRADGSHPICVYVLHLVELAGQAAATLAPYQRRRKKLTSSPGDTTSSSSTSTSTSTKSEHIFNAFMYLEHRHTSVQPFVSTSPYATMHDDVCTLAHDKKVAMVILPFHKQVGIAGEMEQANANYKPVNVNVLGYAPCSVAILINRGDVGVSRQSISSGIRHNVAVYFVGGPDDREALSLAMHLTGNPATGVTVIRFFLGKRWRAEEEEEGDDAEVKEDDEVMKEFRRKCYSGGGSERVEYREEEVEDGEGMVAVIRATSGGFNLVIVGRREGSESMLTAGLSAWSEDHELGVIGDMLASADFGCKASILVVQQRPAERGAAEGGGGQRANTGFSKQDTFQFSSRR